jgi:hypothetical protein
VYENSQEDDEMVEFGGHNNKIAETKVIAEEQGIHLGDDHPAPGLLQEVWQHSQTTWKNVMHGKANLAEYAETGAEVVAGAVAGAVAYRFGAARLAGLAKNMAPEIAETNPFKIPHMIKPSEEILETLNTGTAELKKAQSVVDQALRSGFHEHEILDPRIARFLVDVEASNPELLRTASWVPKVMGPAGASLERAKVFQSMENAGWRLNQISRPDVLAAESILKEGKTPAYFAIRDLRMSPNFSYAEKPLHGLS